MAEAEPATGRVPPAMSAKFDRYERATGKKRETYVREIVALYEAGFSIRSIAAGSGRSASATRKLLLAAGVQLRDRGGRIGRSWRKRR